MSRVPLDISCHRSSPGRPDSCSHVHPGTSLPGSEEDAKEFHVPVLIVGAGPVGTYLSLLLSRYGVSNMVIDRGERGGDHGLGGEGGAHPRAHVLNTRTMEVMREIGIERWASSIRFSTGIHMSVWCDVYHFVGTIFPEACACCLKGIGFSPLKHLN